MPADCVQRIRTKERKGKAKELSEERKRARENILSTNWISKFVESTKGEEKEHCHSKSSQVSK